MDNSNFSININYGVEINIDNTQILIGNPSDKIGEASRTITNEIAKMVAGGVNLTNTLEEEIGIFNVSLTGFTQQSVGTGELGTVNYNLDLSNISNSSIEYTYSKQLIDVQGDSITAKGINIASMDNSYFKFDSSIGETTISPTKGGEFVIGSHLLQTKPDSNNVTSQLEYKISVDMNKVKNSAILGTTLKATSDIISFVKNIPNGLNKLAPGPSGMLPFVNTDLMEKICIYLVNIQFQGLD